MIVDPFTRPISGYDFGSPTASGPHPGIDYGLRYEEIGLPFAVKIEKQGQIDGGVGGNEVLARIVGTPYEVILAHLDRFRRKVGDVVPAGADIAESGSTGQSTGPHLHLQVLDDRRAGSTWAARSVDPRAVLQEVRTMQSVGGGSPGGGQNNSDGCTLVYDPDMGAMVTKCPDGKGHQVITGQTPLPPAQIPNPGDLIANAQKALGDAVPAFLVAGALIGTIGILAFGGIKRIAD